MRTRSATTPHEVRTAILAIWVWRVQRKRRKWRFSDLLLAAVSGTSHDRTVKTAKKAILAISVWRAYMPQWTANPTILARNSRMDSKARSAAKQPLSSDWRFCKCGLVIPLWLPTRFAQALFEESGEQNKKGDFGDHKIPSPPFTKPPFIQPRAFNMTMQLSTESDGNSTWFAYPPTADNIHLAQKPLRLPYINDILMYGRLSCPIPAAICAQLQF